MTILKFCDQVESVHFCHLILTKSIFLQVVKKHKENSCDFFPAVEIENFGGLLQNFIIVVFKELGSETVEWQDPHDDDGVVSNLRCICWSLFDAWSSNQIIKIFETLNVSEISGQMIFLQNSHQSKCKSIVWQRNFSKFTFALKPIKEISWISNVTFTFFSLGPIVLKSKWLRWIKNKLTQWEGPKYVMQYLSSYCLENYLFARTQ